MAYERGLLRGRELSEVQEKALVVYLSMKRQEQVDLHRVGFEEQLAIHRPEAYREYQRQKESLKEENEGYDEIVWHTPQSLEEAAEITRMVSAAHESSEQEEEDQNFQDQLRALQLFKGIDISQLGDEDADTWG